MGLVVLRFYSRLYSLTRLAMVYLPAFWARDNRYLIPLPRCKLLLSLLLYHHTSSAALSSLIVCVCRAKENYHKLDNARSVNTVTIKRRLMSLCVRNTGKEIESSGHQVGLLF